MEKLPDPVIFEILYYLSPEELFLKAALSNKALYTVIENPNFLSRYLEFLLKTSRSILLSTEQCMSLFKSLHRKSDNKIIDFLGFGTTGGVDEDERIYCVRNLYTKCRDNYCSREEQKNITTAGVLLSTQSTYKRSQESFATLKQVLSENFILKEHLRGIGRSFYLNFDRSTTFSLKSIWDANKEYFMQNIEAESERTNEIERIDNLWGSFTLTYPNIPSYRKHPENINILIEPIDFQSTSLGDVLFTSKRLIFHRPVNCTCPIRTFMVFISESYVEIESDAFSIYDNLRSNEDLENFIASPMNPSLMISPLRESLGVLYRSFQWSPNQLKPILWGKFSKNSADVLRVSLNDYFTGVFLYTRLIEPEDLRSQYGDPHHNCNIDASFVGLKGLEFSVK